MRRNHRWLDCCVTKTSQPVASYTSLNTNGHIWTNLFITAYNNADMTLWRKYITSQWRYVRDMASQITGNSTVVFRLNKGDIKAQHYWPFVRGIHRYLITIIIIIIFIIFTSIIISSSLSVLLSLSLSSFAIIIIIIIIFNHYCYCYFCHCCVCVFAIMIIIIIIIIIIVIVVFLVVVVIICIIHIIMSLLL